MPLDTQMQQLAMLLNAGQFQQLEAHARGLIAERPQFGPGWMILALAIHHQGGNALMATGKPDEALLCHQRTTRLEPDSFRAHYTLANALCNLGRLGEAKAGYRRATELAPDFAEAHYNLGNVLQDLGEFDASAASFRRALEIQPDYLDARQHAFYVCAAAGQIPAGDACRRAGIRGARSEASPAASAAGRLELHAYYNNARSGDSPIRISPGKSAMTASISSSISRGIPRSIACRCSR